jgi:hypothetical protein
MKAAPSPGRSSGFSVGAVPYAPSTFSSPASSKSDWSTKPSDTSVWISVLSPHTATLSFMSWPPLKQEIPPM